MRSQFRAQFLFASLAHSNFAIAILQVIYISPGPIALLSCQHVLAHLHRLNEFREDRTTRINQMGLLAVAIEDRHRTWDRWRARPEKVTFGIDRYSETSLDAPDSVVVKETICTLYLYPVEITHEIDQMIADAQTCVNLPTLLLASVAVEFDSSAQLVETAGCPSALY